MQTEQPKNNRLGGILTSVGIIAFLLPILVDMFFHFVLSVNFFLAISFISLGSAYLVVFVRKGRSSLVLIIGTLFALCFLLIGIISFTQLLPSWYHYER